MCSDCAHEDGVYISLISAVIKKKNNARDAPQTFNSRSSAYLVRCNAGAAALNAALIPAVTPRCSTCAKLCRDPAAWSGLDRLGCSEGRVECALLEQASDARSWIGDEATCGRFVWTQFKSRHWQGIVKLAGVKNICFVCASSAAAEIPSHLEGFYKALQ